RLSYLAPDITQAILEGRQPRDLTAEKLLEHSRLPLAWHDQRIVRGFGVARSELSDPLHHQARLTPGLYWDRRGILADPHQRRCGTGIWRDRDIAPGWRDLVTPCVSLPTRSPSQPRKAGVLDPRKQLRERDRLSAGERWIRTCGSGFQGNVSSTASEPQTGRDHSRTNL